MATRSSVRARLSPANRRRVRRVVDPVFRPVGSIARFRTTERVCALTFDDGPDPASTPAILDVLAEHDTRATFFVMVPRAQQHPDLIRRAVAEGHEVSLHGSDHGRLPELPMHAITAKLADARRDLESIVGRPITRMRPPFGSQSVRSYIATRRAGLDPVVWSADAEDWVDRAPAAIAGTALGRVEPGVVLLLHDAWEPDPLSDDVMPTFDRSEVLRRILVRFRETGFSGGSIEGLLARAPAVRTAWFRG